MKILTLTGIILIMLASGSLSAQTEVRKEGAGKPDPQLSQKDNDFLDRQAKVFLDSVKILLKQFPPTPFPEKRERSMAKLLMDAVFHEKFAAFRKPAQDFFHAQAGEVISSLKRTKIDKGAMVWKLYNMGFIVRTKSVTLAFDLVSGSTPGSPDFALSEPETADIVSQCDALFISHRHADHAEKSVVTQFLRQGKPVYGPEQVFATDSIGSKIIHPERNSDRVQLLKLPRDITLKAVFFPGHQMQATENMVSLIITPEWLSFAHLGDQINENDFMKDYEWIDQVAKKYKVDLLMTNCWTNDILRIVKGFNPRLVFPGHELELGHTVWDRVPFWGDDEYLELNYNQLKTSVYPVVVLVWGEGYRCFTE